MAGRVAKDPRFETLPCTHKGTYADDCIVERVTRVRPIPATWFLLLSLIFSWGEYNVTIQ